MLEQIKALFGANFTLIGTPLEGATFNYRSFEDYIEIIVDKFTGAPLEGATFNYRSFEDYIEIIIEIYYAIIHLDINKSGIVTYTLTDAPDDIILLKFTLADISLNSIFSPLYEKSNVDNIIRLIGPLIIENQDFDFILKFEITDNGIDVYKQLEPFPEIYYRHLYYTDAIWTIFNYLGLSLSTDRYFDLKMNILLQKCEPREYLIKPAICE
jgi:hypothetical protein